MEDANLMLNFYFNKNCHQKLEVLALGAHPDDIEIGCSATIIKLAQLYPHLSINWVVFSGDANRKKEANNSAKELLKKVTRKNFTFYNFKDGFFPYEGRLIKECFEEIKVNTAPDIIFTHFRNDLHQDHRLINEMAWNTFRDHLILEYEIPKYDGDTQVPNFYVSVDDNIVDQKIDLIMKNFPSQKNKHWFTPDTFKGIMRLRGVEAGGATNCAEAFYSRKILL
jgi:LmbE family N-acetylglucosaminyl deacetylase